MHILKLLFLLLPVINFCNSVQLTPEETQQIQFSQSSVSSSARAGEGANAIPLPTLVNNMKRDGYNPNYPIQLVKNPDGSTTTLDNRRLAAAQAANTGVYANYKESTDLIAKNERSRYKHNAEHPPKTFGEAVQNRMRAGSIDSSDITKHFQNGIGKEHVRIRDNIRRNPELKVLQDAGFQVGDRTKPFGSEIDSKNPQVANNNPQVNMNSDTDFPSLGGSKKLTPASQLHAASGSKNTQQSNPNPWVNFGKSIGTQGQDKSSPPALAKSGAQSPSTSRRNSLSFSGFGNQKTQNLPASQTSSRRNSILSGTGIQKTQNLPASPTSSRRNSFSSTGQGGTQVRSPSPVRTYASIASAGGKNKSFGVGSSKGRQNTKSRKA